MVLQSSRLEKPIASRLLNITLKYAYNWVELFHQKPEMMFNHPVFWYIKKKVYTY